MQYRSVADLNDVVYRSVRRFPKDVDVVVGIPRSGLLAANLIALSLNLPLADLEGFMEGRTLSVGRTRRRGDGDGPAESFRHALVVDDSINSGKSIATARALLEASGFRGRVTYCGIYGLEDRQAGVDLVLEVVQQPRFFQWNLMHHPWLRYACVDIDGVLCADPTREENDDGERYRQFLESATPLLAPSCRIGWLVTSRLETYRAQTERWLAETGIQYDHLVMLDAPSKAERQRRNAHGSFKGEFYKSSKAILFIESDLTQAQTIARIAGKPALCIETQQLLHPNPLMPLTLGQSLATLPTRFKIGPPLAFVKTRRALRPVRRMLRRPLNLLRGSA